MTIVMPLECESENRNKLNLHAAYTRNAKGQKEGVDRIDFWLLGFFKWKQVINVGVGPWKDAVRGVGTRKKNS